MVGAEKISNVAREPSRCGEEKGEVSKTKAALAERSGVAGGRRCTNRGATVGVRPLHAECCAIPLCWWTTEGAMTMTMTKTVTVAGRVAMLGSRTRRRASAPMKDFAIQGSSFHLSELRTADAAFVSALFLMRSTLPIAPETCRGSLEPASQRRLQPGLKDTSRGLSPQPRVPEWIRSGFCG